MLFRKTIYVKFSCLVHVTNHPSCLPRMFPRWQFNEDFKRKLTENKLSQAYRFVIFIVCNKCGKMYQFRIFGDRKISSWQMQHESTSLSVDGTNPVLKCANVNLRKTKVTGDSYENPLVSWFGEEQKLWRPFSNWILDIYLSKIRKRRRRKFWRDEFYKDIMANSQKKYKLYLEW